MPASADFPFPIRAICDICHGGMQPAKPWCKWNSTRHFAQLHAHEAHGAPKEWSLGQQVAWKQAKRAFEEGVYEVYIPADGANPGVTIQRVA